MSVDINKRTIIYTGEGGGYTQWVNRLGEINAVIVVGSKGGVTLGTLAVSRLVARLQAVEAEDVETFGQDGVLLVRLAGRAGQLLLLGKGIEKAVDYTRIKAKASSGQKIANDETDCSP